jgi:putative oxidoreductase
MNIGILILRLALGVPLAAHATQKLFGWYGGLGLAKTGAFMEQLGFVPGRRAALMAGLSEIVGGLLLVLGLLTPVAAAMVVGVMVVAASALLKHGFFVQNHGYEHVLLVGLAALSVAFTGPGLLSLDALLNLPLAGVGWGLAAFVVGIGGGALQLASRKFPTAQTAS